MAAGLKRLGWDQRTLRQRRKGDPAKVALATTLRAETTVSLAWIAGRLAMGSRGYLAFLLGRSKASVGSRKSLRGSLKI